jgi:hypothetical protein
MLPEALPDLRRQLGVFSKQSLVDLDDPAIAQHG